MKIYTFGYGGKSLKALAERVRELNAIVLDVRFSPRSYVPQWRAQTLCRELEGFYAHVQEWGNAHYQLPELGIKIVDWDAGLAQLHIVEDSGLYDAAVLMCGCTEYRRCHRRGLADALTLLGYEVEELAL